jgi:hypothetical protein
MLSVAAPRLSFALGLAVIAAPAAAALLTPLLATMAPQPDLAGLLRQPLPLLPGALAVAARPAVPRRWLIPALVMAHIGLLPMAWAAGIALWPAPALLLTAMLQAILLLPTSARQGFTWPVLVPTLSLAALTGFGLAVAVPLALTLLLWEIQHPETTYKLICAPTGNSCLWQRKQIKGGIDYTTTLSLQAQRRGENFLVFDPDTRVTYSWPEPGVLAIRCDGWYSWRAAAPAGLTIQLDGRRCRDNAGNPRTFPAATAP